MDSKSFRLIAPSNASSTTYQNNLPQKFKFNLAEPLTLDGTWEVGLTNIIYPATWFNINEDSVFHLRFDVSIASDVDRNSRILKIKEDIVFPRGFYRSITEILETLVGTINLQINQIIDIGVDPTKSKMIQSSNLVEWMRNIQMTNPRWMNNRAYLVDPNRYDILSFNFKRNIRRVRLIPKFPETKLTIKKGLEVWKKLGFNLKVDDVIEIPWSGLEAGQNVSSIQRFPKLFICSNILRDSHIGSTLKPLLRSVHVPQSRDPFINSRYTTPEFVKVNTGYISTLEFWIEDDQGKLIPFQSGKVILTLKFRRIN